MIVLCGDMGTWALNRVHYLHFEVEILSDACFVVLSQQTPLNGALYYQWLDLDWFIAEISLYYF